MNLSTTMVIFGEGVMDEKGTSTEEISTAAPTAPKPTRPGKNDLAARPSASRRQPQSPTDTGPIFWSSLIVGILLIALAVLNDTGFVSTRYHALLIFSEIGIVLRGFDTLATYQWKGLVISGVGVTAIILSFFSHLLIAS